MGQLNVMITGVQELDVQEWRRHTESVRSEVIEWFWAVVGEFTSEQRSLLLAFATGSSRLPPGGFPKLDPKFKLQVVEETGDHLPHSHTCFNQLMLPTYTSSEQLKSKLLHVVSMDNVGFGFG